MAGRTKAVDNVAVKPAPIVTAHAAGYFDVGTTVDHEVMNGFQEAICVPLEDGGVTLDKDNYTQTATLLSGVHAIISNIRTTLATVAVSTYAKKAAIAVTNAICSGTNSVCSAGVSQTASGNQSQCNAGEQQSASGAFSQCNAGYAQTAAGQNSQCNAGDTQYTTGKYAACDSGTNQKCSGDKSKVICGNYQFNDGDRSAVIGGQYIENIDDDCLAFGKGTSTPPTAETYGDKVTNKNVMCKIHCDTGMIDQKEITKSCAVTLNGSGLTPAAVAWADYNDEALINVACTVTCDGTPREIAHGQYFEIDLPPWYVASNARQVSEIDVKPPTTIGSYFVWGMNTNSTTSKARLYLAGPAFTVAAGESFIINCQFHRIHIPTSSYSP